MGLKAPARIMGVNISCPEIFFQEFAQSLYAIRVILESFRDKIFFQELVHKRSEASFISVYGFGIG